jgi:hypothetical protein
MVPDLLQRAAGSLGPRSSAIVLTGKKGNLTIGPTASFEYDYVTLDGFTETGFVGTTEISSSKIPKSKQTDLEILVPTHCPQLQQ